MSDGSPGIMADTVLEHCPALLWSQVQFNNSMHIRVEAVEHHITSLCAFGSCLCVHLVHPFMRLSTVEHRIRLESASFIGGVVCRMSGSCQELLC